MATQGQRGSKAGEKSGTGKFLERLAAEGRLAESRGGDKLKAFMAQADNIRDALAAGYSVKDVWESLRESGEVILSYSLFVQYVRTKLGMRPRRGFERAGWVRGGESELTEEEKRANTLLHGNPTGRQS